MSDFSQLQLAEPIVSSRGAKSSALSNNGVKYVHTVGSREEPLTSPFGASSFGDEQTTRKTIEFRIRVAWVDFFDRFDAWAVTYLTCHSERLFKKPLTIDQVRDGYKPCVSRRGTYPPTLRCKLNIAGVVLYGVGPLLRSAWRCRKISVDLNWFRASRSCTSGL